MSSAEEDRTVLNACVVFNAISRMQPVGISDLAHATAIDKNAVHRVAVTLNGAGWVTRTADGRWSVAPRLMSLICQPATESLVCQVHPIRVEVSQDHTRAALNRLGSDGREPRSDIRMASQPRQHLSE